MKDDDHPAQPLWLDICVIGLLLFLVGDIALVFALPWLKVYGAQNLVLERYAPLTDGQSRLYTKRDADNQIAYWQSQNIVRLLSGRALTTDLSKNQYDALRDFLQRPDETSLSQDEFVNRLNQHSLFFDNTRELYHDGRISNYHNLILRTQNGDFTISISNPAEGTEWIFEPPIQTLGANLKPGDTWQSKGIFNHTLNYQSQGKVLQTSQFSSPLGKFSDCIEIEMQLTFSQGNDVIQTQITNDWYCAGFGLVAHEIIDDKGELISYGEVVGGNRSPDQATAEWKALPTLPINQTAVQGPVISGQAAHLAWELSRVGRSRNANDPSESTLQPTWIPTDPPLLLTASYGSDLVAFDAHDASGKSVWRFHTGGTIYGQPAYDAQRRQIYFGSSDKRLYALDERGLFLWSFETGDNIVSRPAIYQDSVIFGSEDRSIYALNAANGALIWRQTAGGAVVASPALAGDSVIIASDDGGVYNFEADTGEKKWLFTTDEAIEAPVVVFGETAFVASRDACVYAIDTNTGKEIWKSVVGRILRTAPVVGEEAVYVIDENGYLTAFDRQNGKRLWFNFEAVYQGAPLLIDNALLATDDQGSIYRINALGKQERSWAIPAIKSDESRPDFRLGMTSGGGAAWGIDSSGDAWRLGPALTRPRPLDLKWMTTMGDQAFGQYATYAPLAKYDEKAILVDSAGTIYQLDPENGQAVALGALPELNATVRMQPAISDQNLVVTARDTLYALSLPEASFHWKYRGDGFGIFPAVISDQTVLWVTQSEFDNAGMANGTLHALDLGTGRLIWQTNLGKVAQAGNILINDMAVYINTPPSAFDLATGKLLWKNQEGITGLGGATLSADGNVLFSIINTDNPNLYRAAAFRTSDGSLLWQTGPIIENASMFEKLWLSNDTLVIPTLSSTGRITGLEVDNGSLRWSYTPEEPRFGSIIADDQNIWLALQSGQAIALNSIDGQIDARYGDTLGDLSGYNYYQSPAIINQIVIFSLGWHLPAYTMPKQAQINHE
jgi:outer membrane protein assembly factor BamB